ncbi:hypothetical protein D3C81_1308770 [compost metagenome]
MLLSSVRKLPHAYSEAIGHGWPLCCSSKTERRTISRESAPFSVRLRSQSSGRPASMERTWAVSSLCGGGLASSLSSTAAVFEVSACTLLKSTLPARLRGSSSSTTKLFGTI